MTRGVVRGPRWWLRRLTLSRRGHVFRVSIVDRRGVCHGLDADGKRRQTVHPQSPTRDARARYEIAVMRNICARIGPVVDATVRRMQVLADTEVAVQQWPVPTRAATEPEADP